MTDEKGAVEKRLRALEAQVASLRAAATFTGRRGFLTGIALGLVSSLSVLLFQALSAQGAGDALFIDPSGKVGIATTSPLAMLDIQGGADSGGGNDPRSLALSYRNGGYRHWIRTRHNATLGSGNAIDFFVNNSTTAGGSSAPGTGSVLVMTLDSGKVGIGQPSPSAKLDVNGRIRDQTGYVVPVGSIVAYHGATAPDGWLPCDGGAIPDEDKYQDLRTLLGRSTTPDLRGRTLIGAGQGPGLSSRALGQQAGEENHQLTVAEMPSHNHYGFGEGYNNYWPLGQVGSNNNKGSRGGVDEDNYYYNTSSTGGSQPHNNMSPFHVVSYIIKY